MRAPSRDLPDTATSVKPGPTTSSRKKASSSVKTAQRTRVFLKNPSPQDQPSDFNILIQDCNILKNGELVRGSILVENGTIAKIAHRIATATDERINAGNLLAMPGLVDPHVHLRDLDLSYKEDFTSGTSAAAAGGVTTVLDMPNTRPSTDSASRLTAKMERAKGKILVNVGFHAAAVPDRRVIKDLRESGAFSLKLYLPKPIFPLSVDDTVLSGIMKLAGQNNLPLTIHAEEKEIIDRAAKTEPKNLHDLEASRPPVAETLAVSRLLRLGGHADATVYFCHLTLHSSLSMIRRVKGRRVYTEVAPHHLLLSKRSLAEKGWKAWMVPPLRDESNRRKLLDATAKGHVTVIASDHAPHTIKEKKSLPHSLPGVPGLETTLPLLLTLVNRRKLDLQRLVKLTSANPARVFGLISKGKLDVGKDSDIILVDLRKQSKITPESFHSRSKFSPFEGVRTQGVVHTTIVGGNIVYSEGTIVGKPGMGRVLEKR